MHIIIDIVDVVLWSKYNH